MFSFSYVDRWLLKLNNKPTGYNNFNVFISYYLLLLICLVFCIHFLNLNKRLKYLGINLLNDI